MVMRLSVLIAIARTVLNSFRLRLVPRDATSRLRRLQGLRWPDDQAKQSGLERLCNVHRHPRDEDGFVDFLREPHFGSR